MTANADANADDAAIAKQRQRGEQLDAEDPLAHFRQRFEYPDADLVYADGNSLGRLPTDAAALAADVVQRQWGDRLIRGWNDQWLDAPVRLGAKIAPLIGAEPDEVIVADSTTVNFFKLSVAALRHRAGRSRIVSDDLNFPSDLHSLSESIALLDAGHELTLVRSADGMTNSVADVAAALNHDTALVTLSHVAFKSGFLYDMAGIAAAARDVGALTLWDLSHSVGAVDVRLGQCDADMAVGCTYKYLNGGPGSPAFIYVSRRLQQELDNPLAGWMGRADMFGFDLDYVPHPGIRRFLTGTPHVVSLMLIEPGLDLMLEAGIDRVRAKSVALTEYCIDLWEERLEPLGYRLQTPRDPARRGSHVSFGHDEGLAIDLALINDLAVIPDFRAPDNVRVGFAPLYTTFGDVFEVVDRMARVVEDGLYRRHLDTDITVT